MYIVKAEEHKWQERISQECNYTRLWALSHLRSLHKTGHADLMAWLIKIKLKHNRALLAQLNEFRKQFIRHSLAKLKNIKCIFYGITCLLQYCNIVNWTITFQNVLECAKGWPQVYRHQQPPIDNTIYLWFNSGMVMA